jgi:hypothetical protein
VAEASGGRWPSGRPRSHSQAALLVAITSRFFLDTRSRRTRRLFGWQGVVRRLRRPGAGDAVRPRRQPSADADRALQSERARFAAKVDLDLRLACRSEAAMRRELGAAARACIRARAHRRLGFVRLSDYARERHGASARTLQSAAWLASRLDELPAVSTAFDRSEVSWAAARAICKVAVAADEEQWLAIARRSTVDTLERLVARARHAGIVSPDPEATRMKSTASPRCAGVSSVRRASGRSGAAPSSSRRASPASLWPTGAPPRSLPPKARREGRPECRWAIAH